MLVDMRARVRPSCLVAVALVAACTSNPPPDVADAMLDGVVSDVASDAFDAVAPGDVADVPADVADAADIALDGCVTCTLPDATATCVAGRCVVAMCMAGFDDCDSVDANGCEANLQTDAINCGVCGTRCSSGLACVAGACGTIVQIRADGDHTCARTNAGRVYCWGDNADGQCGPPAVGHVDRAQEVTGVGVATQVATGARHTCVLHADGTVACWGANADGQLGDGTLVLRAAPASVVGLGGGGAMDAVEISAGDDHTCARRRDGSVICWGANRNGQLGDGSTTAHASAASSLAVTGLSDAVQISCGAGFTCARRASGVVSCWGNGTDGHLGDGAMVDRMAPTAVMNIVDAAEVTARGTHACARRTAGGVFCWGRGTLGELGDGRSMTSAVPVQVTGLPADTTEVSVNGTHSCARARTGAVYCWGNNASGECGRPTALATLPAAASAIGVSHALEITLGASHSCARTREGAVVCWGSNRLGSLGDGTVVSRERAAAVMGLP